MAAAELEIFENDPVDLSILQKMAQDFYAIHAHIFDCLDLEDLLVADARAYVHRKIGHRLLYMTGVYAITEDGLLCGASVFGTVLTVSPTRFLDTPMEYERSDWHNNSRHSYRAA